MNRERFNLIADAVIKWCIYAIVFAAPFSKSISEIAIILAIVLWASRKIANKDYTLAKTELNIPFLIFVAAMIPSLFVSNYTALSIKAFFTKMLKFVVLYFVIVESINTKSKLKDLFIMTLISAALIMADGLFQYYFSGVDVLHWPGYPSFKARPLNDSEGFFRGFPTACFPFPNDLAAWILLVLLPVACATLFGLKKNSMSYLTGFVSFGLFYLFFLTKTRGAWLALAVSTLYIAVLKKRLWLIILLVLIIAIPFVFKMEMAQYMFAFGSLGDRFGMWGTGVEIFRNHPIIGSGLNTFFANFKEYRDDEFKGKKGSYAHNCYLQMACDVGILGLGAFAWLMISYFISIKRNLGAIKDVFYNSILWGLSIGVFAFLIHSFFDTNLYSLNLATLFWTAIGVSQGIVRTLRQA